MKKLALAQPGFALAAILCAAAAQFLHVSNHIEPAAIFLFAGALFFWFFVLLQSSLRLDTHLADSVPGKRGVRQVSTALVFGLIVLPILTFLSSGGNEFNPDNMLAFILSIGVFLYAFWEPEKSFGDWRVWLQERTNAVRDGVATGIHISTRTLVLIGIVVLAVFFFYYNLDGVPAEMTSDHAEKLLDVNDVVNNGLTPIFFERNTGREPIQFYLTAAFVKLTGHPIDHMALKLITAFMGVLVVLGTYFVARELFDVDVALFAAALVAMSKWALIISRMGLRFPLTPLFVVPVVFFLLRALKHQRRNDFLMTGLFLGAGLYGYIAFRMAPLLVVGFLIAWLLFGRRMDRVQFKEYIGNASLIVALSLVIFVPLMRYSADHPGNFWFRVMTRIAETERPIEGNWFATLAGNLSNSALMFNWSGDLAWPNSIIGDPALDYVSGALFFLGVAFALYRMIRYREWTYAFLLLGLFVMLLPTALSLAFPIENPSNARAAGAIPFVFILAALPLAWITRSLKQALAGFAWGRLAVAGFIVVLLAVTAGLNYVRYFVDFDDRYREASWNSTEVAGAIRGFADSVGDVDHAWILLHPHWMDTRNVAINLHEIRWQQTLPSADDALAIPDDGGNRLFVLNPNDSANLSRLLEIYPNAQQRLFHARTPGHDFLLVYVPGTNAPPIPLTSQNTDRR